VDAFQRLRYLLFDGDGDGVPEQPIGGVFHNDDIVAPDRDPVLLCRANRASDGLANSRAINHLATVLTDSPTNLPKVAPMHAIRTTALAHRHVVPVLRYNACIADSRRASNHRGGPDVARSLKWH
jgi:hypothetical protein